MDINSLFSAFSLMAVCIYMYIGIFTYRQAIGSTIHEVFLLLCTSYAIWSFAYAFAYVSTDKYVFCFWNKISAIGWCSFSALILFLTLLITENNILKKRGIKSLLFFPAFVFFFMAVFLFGEGIHTPRLLSNLFYIGNFLYNFIYLLASIYLFFIWGRKTDSLRIKKQSNILVLSSIIPFTLNLLTQDILPRFGIDNVPLMGQLYSVIMIFGTYIVITKYNFLKLPEKFILEEVTKEILDMVIIADHKGTIIRVSQHTLNMMGYEESDLLKQNIEQIFDGENKKITIDQMKQRDDKYDQINLLKKNGEKIPVNISCKRIFNSNVRELLGFILVVQDISLLYELQQNNQKLKKSEENLRSIIDNNPMSIQIIDGEGHTKKVNDAFIKLFGSIPHPDYSVFDDMQIKQQGLQELMDRAKSGGVVYFPDFFYNAHLERIEFRDTPIWIRAIIFPIFKNGLQTEQYVVMHENVTERKRMEKQIFSEKERLKATLLSVYDGVISTDKNGTIELMNGAGEKITGWRQEETIGKSLEEVFHIVDEVTGQRCENPVLHALKTGKVMEIDSSKMLISKNGVKKSIEDSVAPIKDENGNISGAVLVFRDYTEKKERQNQIEYLSYHDQLTGLYNRRFLEEELNRLDEERNFPLSVVMADVNGLKLINDSFGHHMGDELLKKVAEIIRNGCRKEDIIARLGGDEFIVLLPKTDTLETEKIIKKIKILADKEKIEGIDISISFGYEIKRDKNTKMQEALKKAEDQMYKKKLFESPSIRGKTVQTIINTLHEKNKREEQHSHRVSALCKSMGAALQLSENEIEELKTVGLLHDIGKIAIEENILNKPGGLSEDERKQMMRHPEIGYRILSTVHDMSDIATYVLYHHERIDGKGYPKGLTGDQIPLESRIISIADSYDAMTSDRSYQKALSKGEAIMELQKNAGTQFDSELVNLFIEKVLKEEIG
ncbi:HD domain-containing phosphohydrolase [Clostridium aminobutyricum]|uniref:PAS domain S-box protein n=1 Tax=Clostridium aminobutyricum TaxID=33953 RepID=A0A939D8A5_CLOAM|nr:HD domain-containing phosphohydrolase [Clostridium aminobutyricum]MBN7772912.1 PAS domain S-box protein [Clostridium aminobutyricum]